MTFAPTPANRARTGDASGCDLNNLSDDEVTRLFRKRLSELEGRQGAQCAAGGDRDDQSRSPS